MTTPTTTVLPANLRVADLIAKTARVTLKDTLRVIAALDAVSYLYEKEPVDILEACTYDPHRPTPEQVAACEQAFYALREAGNGGHPETGTIKKNLKLVKSLV